MGSGGSKVGKQMLEEDLQKSSVPCTPISTPKVKENNDLDPRSPSTHISRTPLQLLSAAAGKLGDLKQSELYSLGNETPVNSKKVLLGIDPRSPTTEFQRTPIIINVIDSQLPKKLHNKNLDKVRRSTIITTPNSTLEKQNVVSPKLLDSSPIKPKLEVKRKSFVGLLETNIDFTETNLDTVILEKCRNREKPMEDVTPALKNRIVLKTENVDPRSPTNDFLRTPIQIVKKISDIEVNDEETDSVIELEVKHNDKELVPEEVSVEVENYYEEKSEIKEVICAEVVVENNTEQILPAKIADAVVSVLQNVENLSVINDDVVQIEENLPVMLGDIVINNAPDDETGASEILKETKSAPVTPPVNKVEQICKPIISPIPKETKSAPVTPPLGNITADVKELDKKLTNLIYQDDIVICPRIVRLKEHSNRSPLKNRNISEPEKKKSAQKLKVSDKPRKSDYVVSKIPVFKEKGKNIEVQCENTPPRNMEKRKVKVKKSHWDNADTTLII